MKQYANVITAYTIMIILIILVGIFQSWSVALSILNFCLVSAVMTMGANIQWGYAGLINFGIMGYTALGGLAAVLVSVAPVQEAWAAGGLNMIICAGIIVGMVFSIRYVLKKIEKSKKRNYLIAAIIIVGLILLRVIAGPATEHIEAVNPAKTGFLGGLGMPILFSWIVGAFFAGGLAYIVGKVALGLRADYLAIATIGIGEIFRLILKNEIWATNGARGIAKIPLPFETLAEPWNKIGFMLLVLAIVVVFYFLIERARLAPWGRLMTGIRENEHSARAAGKNVERFRIEAFVCGSILMGLAGGLTAHYIKFIGPGATEPLTTTFLVWVMLIAGGSGNNRGAVLGAFLLWMIWSFTEVLTGRLPAELAVKAAYFRIFLIGLLLQVVLQRYAGGILPERRPTTAQQSVEASSQ